MADILEQYTIDQVVNETMLTLPLDQQNEFQKRRFFSFAMRGIRELRLMITEDGAQWTKITPNDLNEYSFPDDCAQFIAVGVPVDGEIWYLSKNNKIIRTTSTSGGTDYLDSTVGEGVSLPTSQFDTFTSTGGINLEGYVTVDERNRKIRINNNRQTDLIFVYVSSGISKTTTTYIPAKYLPALIAYILWKDIEFDRNIPGSSKILYKRTFDDEKRKILAIESDTIWEVFDAWASGNSLIF